ncbi:MAG TPA: chemotaxis protein CheW [Polyangiaceae bacterium]|nr:chemotaxis protein CheW [Polyangiaceae bacterium]
MSDAPTTAALVFRVRDRLCTLPLEHVVETMRPQPVKAVAGAPPYVAGIALIRGSALPVVDVARLLDVSAAPTSTSDDAARFVTVRAAHRTVALAVDAVVGVRGLTPGAFRDLPPLLRDAAPGGVTTIASLDAELLVVLDAARIAPAASLAERLDGTAR